MTTLAIACDRILENKLEEALDVMSQRFKRMEAQDNGELKGHVASRLELIPAPRVTSLSLEEREEVVDLDRKWQEYQAGREGLGQGGGLQRRPLPQATEPQHHRLHQGQRIKRGRRSLAAKPQPHHVACRPCREYDGDHRLR